MDKNYIESLRRLLDQSDMIDSDGFDIAGYRAQIKKLKYEIPEKKHLFDDLLQASISQDNTAKKLIRIIIESEIEKLAENKGSKPINNINNNNVLQKSIQYVKGVGPALFEKFKKKGITTIKDALFFFPRDYEDRRNIIQIAKIQPNENVTVTGKVIGVEKRHRTFVITISDGSGVLDLTWFNIQKHYYEYLIQKFGQGVPVIASGRATIYRRYFQITHPVIKETSQLEDDIFFKRIIPIYSSIEGISEGHLIKIMKTIVEEFAQYLEEFLPENIRKKYNLIELKYAISQIHFPGNETDFEMLHSNSWQPLRRVIFDELFALELLLASRKNSNRIQTGVSHSISKEALQQALRFLPFELTNSQKNALSEIIEDLKKGEQMNRILIGDVGSGKTAVAMISSYLVALCGYQVAILVPTEILARQHHKNFCNTFRDIKDRISLLTGSITGSERSRILGDIELGHQKIIIGTHALLEEKIRFKNLTYVIIDEQHQFGINQRAIIKSKGLNADLLMMSATPIPRTLAISLYGDLDISMIKELPPNRKKIETKIIRGEKSEELYSKLRKEVENGEQCYIVYPLISTSDRIDLKAAEDMYRRFMDTHFKGISIGLLHGKMQDNEKTETMNKFKNGEIKILIATTVIEVGVDVPTASIMVIEHAERFGLSQLHQLRGRVGRGDRVSYCYLVAYNWLSQNAYERLKIMEKTSDGFKIAEEDLRIRGPGELAGTKQSGLPDLHMSNLIRDADILEQSRIAAFEIISNDPDLVKIEHNKLREILALRRRELENITTS